MVGNSLCKQKRFGVVNLRGFCLKTLFPTLLISWSFCLILGAFQSDLTHADSIALQV